MKITVYPVGELNSHLPASYDVEITKHKILADIFYIPGWIACYLK